MVIPRLLRSKTANAVLLATVVLSAVTALRAFDPAPVAQLRERSFDIYQQLQPRPYADFPVRIIEIDEASLAQYGQWPWPRTLIAQFVQRLSDLGAAVIALDMIFPEPDRTSPSRLANTLTIANAAEAERVKNFMAQLPDHDELLAETIRQAPVVLGFGPTKVPNGHRPPVKTGFAMAGANPAAIVQHFSGTVSSLSILDAAASGVGSMSVSGEDKSGIIRRVPLLFTDGNKTYPSLSAEAL